MNTFLKFCLATFMSCLLGMPTALAGGLTEWEANMEDWVVYNKGNKHVLFRYIGRDLNLQKKLLRLRMVPPSELASKQEALADLLDGPTELAFQKDFVAPILGAHLLVASELVGIKSKTLAQFNELLLGAAGEHLEGRRPLDLSLGYGMLQDDVYALQDHAAYLVEIKPKYGFLSHSPFLPGPDHIKRKVSRFSLQQRLKLAQGRTEVLSGYDPLDLFSGNALRILRAIKHLIAAPQNNLRVFDAQRRLLHDADIATLPWLPEALLQVLSASDVLQALAGLQALDTIDVEGAHILYQYDQERLVSLTQEELWQAAQRPKVGAPMRLVDSPNPMVVMREVEALGFEGRLQLLRQYLLAAVGKDCSLLVSFAPAGSNALPPFVNTAEGSFTYVLKIVDTEPKTLGKIPLNYANEQTILDLWQERGLR